MNRIIHFISYGSYLFVINRLRITQEIDFIFELLLIKVIPTTTHDHDGTKSYYNISTESTHCYIYCRHPKFIIIYPIQDFDPSRVLSEVRYAESVRSEERRVGKECSTR